MSNDWNSYERAAEKGPWPIFWKVVVAVVLMSAVLGGIGYVFGWFGQAAQVTQDEFGPKAALQKYEWFINQAAAIQKADKDVALFDQRIKDIDAHYAPYGTDKTKWLPSVQAQYNHDIGQARDDRLAVVSNRNALVRDYNAQSAKFNWAPFQSDPRKPQEKFFDLTP